MKRYVVFGAILAASLASLAKASPVSSIQLGNGQVLNIQSLVWQDPTNTAIDVNTAYLDVDFSNNTPAGPAFAWEYRYSSTQYLSDMIDAVATADKSFSYSPDPVYGNSFIDNFNYGTNIGSANYNGDTNPNGNLYWGGYYGSYDAGAQNVDWNYAPWGNTSMQLGIEYDSSGNVIGSQDGMFYGSTINDFYGSSIEPVLPTVVPEPTTLSLICGAALCLLRRRSHRRATAAE